MLLSLAVKVQMLRQGFTLGLHTENVLSSLAMEVEMLRQGSHWVSTLRMCFYH